MVGSGSITLKSGPDEVIRKLTEGKKIRTGNFRCVIRCFTRKFLYLV